jgi:hypothetical protein
MSEDKCEVEVSAIEYVGPHSVRPNLYEIVLLVGPAIGAPTSRLRLLFRPAEAMLLAHMLERNPPRIEPEDHLAHDIARLQT